MPRHGSEESRVIANRFGELYLEILSDKPQADAATIAAEMDKRLSAAERRVALRHLIEKQLVPVLRMQMSKQSQGKDPHPRSYGTARVEPQPTPGIKTKGKPRQYRPVDVLRYATVNGIALLDHTHETLAAAMAANEAKAHGYLMANVKLKKIDKMLAASGVERVGDIEDLEAVVEVWQSDDYSGVGGS